MAGRDLPARLARRLRRAGLDVPKAKTDALLGYLDLLCKWNRRINLTALKLEPSTDEAVDRLVIEPILASSHVGPEDGLLIDIGSGGGSPAIPIKVVASHLRLIMVEVKVRKSAFLREAVRHLELKDVEVANSRFEELLARSELHESADVVSVRAVRPDPALWNGVQAFLRPGGRVLWFSSVGISDSSVLPPLHVASKHPLVPTLGSQLIVLTKQHV